VYWELCKLRPNGKVERSHGANGEEFYSLLIGVVIHNAQLFKGKPSEWKNFYNYCRPMWH